MKSFDKILIANRGEIALRVIRGARRLGLRTVAVYSDADAGAPHVRAADEAVRIGPASASESYLDIARLLDAARASGAQAVHPGYGFLSERAEFARAVTKAGLVFIGPDASAIEAMGHKSAAKRLMIEAGVPCVPGYEGREQSDDRLAAEARQVGMPVMVKAAAGGGGRGMRLVRDEAQLAAQIRSARSEAKNAFGSGELLIEKAVEDARHVEIQVFGDRHGHVVHLGERDCSVQRRNQKVVEEAPSPAVDEALRARMGEAAVAAARAVDYVGAGTVEFLLGADGAFYFLEMNTRLQVEHPVTELIHELDLVEWQIRVARGEALPLAQADIDARRRGHAIEVRLCAEDVAAGYIPQSGPVLAWRPPQGEGLRVDAGLETGAVISPYYDSMQAKLIAWGEDRETARARLLAGLGETMLAGVISNRDFLRAVLAHPEFAAGQATTAFIGRHFAGYAADPTPRQALLAAVALYLDDAARLAEAHDLAPEYIGWHSSQGAPVEMQLMHGESRFPLRLEVERGRRFGMQVEGARLSVEIVSSEAGLFRWRALDGEGGGTARHCRSGDELWLDADGALLGWRDRSRAPAEAAVAGSDGRILAHSDGRIVAVEVQAGDTVAKGATLVVLEAMKMEFQLTTPVAGVVEAVNVEPGQQVRARQLLAQLRPGEE